jgi:hypothetical protein
MRSTSEQQYFLPYRRSKNRKAIIFVHGFAENVSVWAAFAKLVMADPELRSWDLFSLGYRSSIAFDWFSSRSSLAIWSNVMKTNLELPPIKDYVRLAFVAHSTGGW